MKTFFTLFAFFSLSSSLFAQVENGFYRVINATTDRYLYVYDDRGEASTNKIDIDAIYLRADLEYAISDPGSIIYVEKIGSSYNFSSQGTSVYDIMGRYLSLREDSAKKGQYAVGAEVAGVRAFLSDKKASTSTGYGTISTDSNGARFWVPIPVSSSSDNYFGVNPSVSAGDKYYAPFYASFGISPANNSTTVYYVSEFKDCAVLLKEKTGTIAPSTPVIIECSSQSPADNVLDLEVSGSYISDNLLSGVYFDTDNSNFINAVYGDHKNQVSPTNNTRLLSVNSNGKLCFSKTSLASIPANSSYLEVSSSANDDLVVFFNKDEYDAYNVSSLDELNSDATKNDIYDLLGKKVLNNESLPVGIYIIGGKKMVVR